MLFRSNFDLFRPPTSWADIANGTAWRGGAQQFRIEAVPGAQVSRYLVSWRDPYFLDQNFSLGVSGFYYQRFFPNWNEQRLGGRVAVGQQINSEWSTSVALRLEDVGISNPSRPTPQVLQEALGHSFLSTVRGSIVHDTRDSPFMAGSGHYLELGYEQGFGEWVYPKIDLEAKQYFTLYERPTGGHRQILSFAGNVGWAGEDTPIFERYYAGGFQSFRGFAFYGVTPREMGVRTGGTWQTLGSVEYLLPITADDMIQVVAFSDFGTVDSQVSLDNFRVAVGTGLRLTIPMMACQFSPRYHPPMVRMAVQIADPAVVNTRNRPIGMRFMPAGTEIRLRTSGITRPKKTTASPCFRNVSSVRSTSRSSMNQ